jgi:hypothetical protein
MKSENIRKIEEAVESINKVLIYQNNEIPRLLFEFYSNDVYILRFLGFEILRLPCDDENTKDKSSMDYYLFLRDRIADVVATVSKIKI